MLCKYVAVPLKEIIKKGVKGGTAFYKSRQVLAPMAEQMKTLRIMHGLLFAVIIFIKRATNPYYTWMISTKHFHSIFP